MKKYNLSNIMKAAWAFFRKYNAGLGTRRDGSKIIHWSFSTCLKKAWTEAKEVVEKTAKIAKTGICRMHYSEYKNNYSECQTVPSSYDKRTKTIEVMTRKLKNARVNGLCPYCHTYCYGDCRA